MSVVITGSISIGDIAVIVTLLFGFGGIYKWTHDYRENWIDKLLDSQKFVTKLNEFIGEALQPYISNLPAPGNPYTKEEKESLLYKQKKGTLTFNEAVRLQQILNEDIERARKGNDIGTIIVLTIALIALVALISALSKN